MSQSFQNATSPAAQICGQTAGKPSRHEPPGMASQHGATTSGKVSRLGMGQFWAVTSDKQNESTHATSAA